MYLHRNLLKVVALLSVIFLSVALNAADDKQGYAVSHVTFETLEVQNCANDSLKKMVTYYYDGEYVGYILYGIRGKKGEKNKNEIGWIELLSIKEKFRSQGFGSYFLQEAITQLKNDGYKKIGLEAKPLEAMCENYGQALEKLITFYEKNGFIVQNLNTVRAVMEAPL